jgi:DNA-binding response OmpR family regulator
MARILVIDDDIDLLQMTRLMLQRGGHEVIVTVDGADGITKCQQMRPDMAIVDVMMPGINGYQVVRRLREDPATANIVTLILTARAQPVDRDAAMAARADDYMAKPVAPAELLKKVNELLSKHSQAVMPAKLVIAVFSLRGGAGATTLAVNLGMAFQQAGRRVCIVDLSTRSGHVAMQFRLQSKTSWVDLLPQMNVLGAEHVEKVLLKHESGLSVMPSPFLPPVQPIDGEALAKLLALLKSLFDAVVIDSSGTFDIIARTALGTSDFVMALMTPELASLQTALAMVRMFNTMSLPDDKIILVSNQVTPRAGLPVQSIEKALGKPIKVTVPYEEAQATALGQGTPLIQSNPDAPLPAAIKQAMGLFAQRRT